MIRKDMEHLGSVRSAIRELFEYGMKRKAEIGQDKVFDFSLGNPSVAPPSSVNQELLRLINETEPTALHGYTSAQGDKSTREEVARYITETQGFRVCADDLYMTVGAAAALSCALSALCGVGEEVIVLAPYFPEYKVFISQAGATVREVMCDPVSFQPDIDAIKAAISEKTAAIIVNSPCNPTGAVYTEEKLRQLTDALKAAEKKYGKPIYLIADEPYRELVYGGARVEYLPKLYDDCLVCYSFSKSLSIPGERIGYLLVSPRTQERGRVYAAVCGAGRSLGYVCAPSLLQKLVPYCLGECADIEIYDRNRKLLLEKLTEYGFEAVKPEGAFYLFLKAPDGDAEGFSEAAKRHELLLVPSTSFGCGGFVRISYCVSTEQIENALPAFRALANEYFGV